MRRIPVVALLLLTRAALGAPDTASVLATAQRHFSDGDYAGASKLAGPLARDPAVPKPDRAEAWRLVGLSLFYLGLQAEADDALLEFLRLEPDAHLDPALVRPEAIVFFEDVRGRHIGELRALRPRWRKRYFALNLLPPVGQFQNGHTRKAWTLGATELILAGTHVTTYLLLTNSCADDGTCKYDRDTANALRTANLASGVLLLGVYLYGILDGWAYYDEPTVAASMALVPSVSGGSLVLDVRF